MMRKNLGRPEDLANLPSLLGRIFRIALYGGDSFDYELLAGASAADKLAAWKRCRDSMGMHATYDPDDKSRQQYQPMYVY